MGKMLVMHRDTTYAPSAVYGFEWVEVTPSNLAGVPMSWALKIEARKSRSNGLNFFTRVAPFIKLYHFYSRYKGLMKKWIL